MPLAKARFEPDAVVVQCGADGLARDPCRAMKLTVSSLTHCVGVMLDWNLPTLILGGGLCIDVLALLVLMGCIGGYNHTETAKLCTLITARAIGIPDLAPDIPVHVYYDQYFPAFSLHIESQTAATNAPEVNIMVPRDLVESIPCARVPRIQQVLEQSESQLGQERPN